ncbi:MAG: NAD(P)H-dependent oxidoreductase subunit E [Clostridiales bacterium]|nr:NAD(P)H-dependent oxidoreductase subunit E [Clostridiales bacterium]
MKTVKVCIGSACHLKGSYEIINILKKAIEKDGNEDKLSVKASFCLGNCEGAVSVAYDDNIYSLQPATTEEFYETVIKETL